MKEPKKITWELVKAHGLSEEEYNKIKDILGREPNFTELGIFSAMWSEHCSYKSSKPVLKLFPTSGKNILVKAGEENAGVIDIGDGLAIVMKAESHNHPSAVEPFQGAATGVGGVLRDIFTMGARPIALLSFLRFGRLDSEHNRHLFTEVMKGSTTYGNSVGIPTIGGEIYFDETYEGNPLVNVMCVGVVNKDELIRAKASGVGNLVFYVGADTGRDGLGGASFASRDFTDESEQETSAVAIGDPLREKLLLEACLELLKTGAVVGMQDMGAAGLTSSSSEMASRAGSGVEIDISLVPRREEGMIPYEVMLSESQERMLLVVKKEKEKLIRKIFDKRDLYAVSIGRVTSDGFFRVLDKDRIVAEIPARSLAEKAPVYTREEREPSYLKKIKDFPILTIPEPKDYNDILKRLLTSPSISFKQWIYEQYDSMVGTDTILQPGANCAFIQIKGTKKAIALTTGGNGSYCYLNSYEGGKIAVAEAARNIVCAGAKPLAITNCLNFGNPTKPAVFWQFKKCVEGMAEACRILETPVTGGNVSFYNENPTGAIDPTPMVGMLGLMEDIEFRCRPNFKEEGDVIVLLGDHGQELGGSEYLRVVHGLKKGDSPQINLEKEKAVQKTCLEAIRAGLVNCAHHCSEGGLAVALAESCFSNSKSKIGVVIQLSSFFFQSLNHSSQSSSSSPSPSTSRPTPNTQSLSPFRADALLFGETQSRIIISCPPEDFAQLKNIAQKNKAPFSKLGEVRGRRLIIKRDKDILIDMSIDELEKRWRKGLRDSI